jgi:hypothetical protein
MPLPGTFRSLWGWIEEALVVWKMQSGGFPRMLPTEEQRQNVTELGTALWVR